MLERLLATCASDRLVDARDAALLLVAFASGGRRRSEVAGLRVEQLIAEAPVPADPSDPKSAKPALSVDPAWPHQDHRGRRRTQGCFSLGVRSQRCGNGWRGPKLSKGPVFRAIDQWGGLDDKALTPQSVNAILKRRIALGRARSQGVFRAWAAGRLSDRGGAARGFVAGGDAAVAASLGAAGGELLQ